MAKNMTIVEPNKALGIFLKPQEIEADLVGKTQHWILVYLECKVTRNNYKIFNVYMSVLPGERLAYWNELKLIGYPLYLRNIIVVGGFKMVIS